MHFCARIVACVRMRLLRWGSDMWCTMYTVRWLFRRGSRSERTLGKASSQKRLVGLRAGVRPSSGRGVRREGRVVTPPAPGTNIGEASSDGLSTRSPSQTSLSGRLGGTHGRGQLRAAAAVSNSNDRHEVVQVTRKVDVTVERQLW